MTELLPLKVYVLLKVKASPDTIFLVFFFFFFCLFFNVIRTGCICPPTRLMTIGLYSVHVDKKVLSHIFILRSSSRNTCCIAEQQVLN